MKPPFFKVAAASPAVQALLGVPPRIALAGEVAKPVYPYLTYTLTIDPDNYVTDPADSWANTLTLDIWGKDQPSVDAVEAALLAALQGHCYVETIQLLGADPQTKSLRTRITLSWHTVA